MTKIEAAAAAVERAERRKKAAFHQASLAREEARRALTALSQAVAEQRERRAA